ncbi:MAG: hypothetical protein RLZZ15_3490 [Verrucomicrobiota bacterium]|jgi:hypothetical protein
MIARRTPSRRLLALAAAALLALAMRAAPAESSRASSSPFLPAQTATPNAAAAANNATLDFLGVMDLPDGRRFRIIDAQKKTGVWIGLNELEPKLNFVIKQHDPSGPRDTITVEQAGRSFTLQLREGKVVSSGAAGSMVPPPMSNVPAAVTNAVVVNPSPADEQARLDAVVAEVARRRALRDQSAPPVTPAPPPPARP